MIAAMNQHEIQVWKMQHYSGIYYDYSNDYV